MPTAADAPAGARASGARVTPLKISRVLAIRALHQGIDAADAGADVTSCPYPGNGTLAEEFAAHWWIKGWRRRHDYLDDTDVAE